MNKFRLVFALAFCVLAASAQEKVNLVVFSEDGDPFFAYINGIRQNDRPEANVKITGLSPNISLRIVFEDKTLPELKQNMALEPGYEHTAKIRKDLKKQVKLRYFGQTPLTDEATPGVATVQYHVAENPIEETPSRHGGTQSFTTTTTTTSRSHPDENVSVNIGISGVGVNMNVNTNEHGYQQSTSVTSTTVTSTASTRAGSQRREAEPAAVSAASTAGCNTPISSASFSTMKQSIESKPFSDTKMSTAKVATKNACLSVAQVKEICGLFSMDDDKLSYAKYAYDYCVEKSRYYTVGDVFSFSTTTDEFNRFLESK